MERVLITGGTGFVGRAAVRALLDRGFAVRVLARGRWPFKEHPRLERVDGAMTNAASLRDAVRDCDAVVHAAARKNDEADSVAVNVDGTRMLCEAAAKEGVEKIVYVSTQSARLTRRGTYGETKRRAEELVRSSGIPFVILRPSLVYGDGDAGAFATVEKLSRLPVIPVFGEGTAVFRPIHVDDVAAAVVGAIGAPTEKTYDVAGPDALSFDALIRRAQAMHGVERPIVHLPLWLGLFAATLLSVLPRPPVTRSNVLGGVESFPMDIDGANAALGISPRPFDPEPSPEPSPGMTLVPYASGGKVPASAALADRFDAACAAHGIRVPPLSPRILLPYIDAASRLWAPRGAFRSAMLIAAAVAEATPEGAAAYLPKNSSPASTVLRSAACVAAGAWYALVGSILWTFPALRRHAS